MRDDVQHALASSAVLLGRLLLGAMFVFEGWSQLNAYAAASGYMQRYGVPGGLLPLVIATETGAGLCLVLGWQTRWAALLLAGFSALAALIFHNNFADNNQFLHFEKDFAIAGGLLALAVAGGGRWSLDHRRT